VTSLRTTRVANRHRAIHATCFPACVSTLLPTTCHAILFIRLHPVGDSINARTCHKNRLQVRRRTRSTFRPHRGSMRDLRRLHRAVTTTPTYRFNLKRHSNRHNKASPSHASKRPPRPAYRRSKPCWSR